MSRRPTIVVLVLVPAFLVLSSFIAGQTLPASDPQALAFAGQSIAALVGNVSISDVTLTGSMTWNGSDTGAAILQALGTARAGWILP